jgi:phytoene dehydrogenase-like protein
MKNAKYDVVVIGAGMGGLTTANYCARAGLNVLLLEKEPKAGGLFGSFVSGDYIFDHGARAVENSGIMFPMFKQLGIELDFVRSPVTIGIEDQFVQITSDVELEPYVQVLTALFPEEEHNIRLICADIVKISQMTNVLYGFDNPLFLDDVSDKEYLLKELLPWTFKLLSTLRKTKKYFHPVQEHLERYTSNQSLIDMIIQHFFEDTPTQFALSYFTLYTDYNYPKGGTKEVVAAMVETFQQQGGTLLLESAVESIDLDQQLIQYRGGQVHYDFALWGGSGKYLHDVVHSKNPKLQALISKKQTELSTKKGADSAMTVFMKVKDKGRALAKKAGMHTFYTPIKEGLSKHPLSIIKEGLSFSHNKQKVLDWVARFYELNTFEISVPVLRDETLAPKGESGFIVSTLMDYSLVKFIQDQGWYEDLKELTNRLFVDILDQHWLHGLKDNLIDRFWATPLTMEKFASTYQGSLSGWSFRNAPLPSEFLFSRVNKTMLTGYPNLFQAGQWAFAPAGLPTAALTGKLAADKIIKLLRKKR